jgi:PAS domain S-box-containing protein
LESAKWAGFLAALIGLLVLAGWVAGFATLEGILPAWPRLGPGAALAFILAGADLCRQADAKIRPKPPSSRGRKAEAIPAVGAAVVVGVGLLFLGESLWGWRTGIEQLWFRAQPAGVAALARVSPAAAVDFVLIGAALLAARRPRSSRLHFALALPAALIGALGLSDYILGSGPPLPAAAMPLHEAVAFLLLGAGVVALRTEAGPAALLTRDSIGGRTARVLLPLAVLAPLLLGRLRLEGQYAGWYDTEAGTALFALANVAVFGLAIWVVAARLNRSDLQRDEAEREQARLAAIVASSDDAIVGAGLDGTIISWNQGAVRLYGHSAAEAAGRSVRMLLPPERAGEEDEILARAARGEGTDHFDTVRLHRDGRPVDVSLAIAPIRDGTGRVVGISKIARDIGKRRTAERRLRAQFERLGLLNELTRALSERLDLEYVYEVVVSRLESHLQLEHCSIFLLTADGRSLVPARAGRRAPPPGQAPIDLAASGLRVCAEMGRLLYEPDIGGAGAPLLRALAGEGLRSLAAAPLAVESRIFVVLLAGRREPDAISSGECEFLTQLAQNVALAAHQAELYGALKRAYDELRQTQQAVLQHERLRTLGQMASGIAHDINNAISPVVLYTESMLERESGLSAAGREQLAVIQRAVEDVAHTVGRMREFYRQREADSEFGPVPLERVAEQVLDLTRARWHDEPQRRGAVIEVRRDFSPGLPAVLGAESEIREALTNLVINALDAMPNGGALTLRTRPGAVAAAGAGGAGGQVQIEVADTGIGMDEETRRRCFEPFFTTKGERGTGLGLAMVYGTVRRHGAEVEIESSPGQGTTMRLTFPAAVEGGAEARAEEVQPSRPLRLLVVDDDPLLLRSIREVLEADGHQVTCADGGRGGLEALRSARERAEPFDAVVTDLGMPYVDGRKVAAAAKEGGAPIPVVMLTGWGQRLTAEDDIPPHVDTLLSKPPKIRDLRRALAACARRPVA